MRQSLRLLSLLAVMLPATASADSIVVLEPTTIGLEESVGAAFVHLLRSELRAQGLTVAAPEAVPPGPCADPACAAEAGRTANSTRAVTVSLTRLESRIVLQTSLVDVSPEAIVFSDRATAATADDLDPLSIRVARALAEEIPIASTVRVSEVTRREAEPQLRRRAFLTVGLALHSAMPVDGYGSSSHLTGGELIGLVEMNHILVAATLGTHSGGGTTEGWADGGLYYIFADTDVSPFAGGGVGRHSVSVKTGEVDTFGDPVRESGSGNALWAGGGLMILRTADVHVFALAKYNVNLFTVAGEVPHSATLSAGATLRF